MPLDITRSELDLAERIAWGIGARWSRVRVEDVRAELHLWMCENHKYLLAWREEGKHGTNKLGLSLRRAANKFCRREHDTIKPAASDYAYSTQAAAALIEALLTYPDWSEFAIDGDSDVWASLSDMSRAYQTLSPADQRLLRWRLGEGRSYDRIAAELGLPSPDAARMRVNRALARGAERASHGITAHWPAHTDLAPRGRPWLNGTTGGTA